MINLSRWPRKALPYREIIAAAVESFVAFPLHREFNQHRSACEQLCERIEEFGIIPNQREAMQLIREELTEAECLAICLSPVAEREKFHKKKQAGETGG
jgi:hypothetical protein